jgi:surfeit locus 1 family protein
MFRRNALFLVIGSAAVLACIRLGFWQLGRLAEKRASNQEVAKRLARQPIPVERLPAGADTAARRFHQVRLEGTLDYDREIVLTARVRRGSPGVHIFTPLRRAGNDTAVLVNRGWIYSPDGIQADLARWRDADAVTVHGYTDRFTPPPSTSPPRSIASSANPRAVHRLDYEQLRPRFPYPIAAYTVVWVDSVASAQAQTLPVRAGLPELSEGSHLSYAIQWFGFGLIGSVGMVFFIRKGKSG